MGKVLLGSISYCLGNENPKTEARIRVHQEELRWLESLHLEDTIEYEYFRVEQAYTPEFAEAVKTTLNLTSITYDRGIGPAAARNVLLKKLYESDVDWLVCMDDDRNLYSHYNGGDFIKELGISPHLAKLASQGTMVTCVCPAYRPFKKINAEFGMVGTHWNLRKCSLDGCLQVVMIPNLVKYNMKPIWFDETNDCMEGKPPEDEQFEMDWLLAKHGIAANYMMIMRELDKQEKSLSTIYENQEKRLAVQATHPDAINKYIREKTHNRITNPLDLNKRYNPFNHTAIPRVIPYTPVQSDYGKYKTI